ncbi:MAG: Integral rane sensor signal transduction histidine kinase [Chthoniobacteraceae bacterium]|nr:Integral rane sensor signal transduction histidine kinase [Chthoniobacteraceae bacterium]
MAVLCAMGGALYSLHFLAFKREYENTLKADAEVAASLCAKAIATSHIQPVAEILSAFKLNPRISAALVRLHDAENREAGFGTIDPLIRTELHPDGLHHTNAGLIYVQALIHDGKRLGTLILVSRFKEDTVRVHKLSVPFFVMVLGATVLAAFLIACRLGRVISDPIDSLAETARRIGARNDYSLRAQKWADDEFGECTECFNLMLDRIQNRDSALRYEISERARAEDELQQAHQQFIEASRQEGMADVATCVLHNVGNVLNSVNVSATLITENLSLTRTENLVRATSLLQMADGGISRFLADDPKGQLLPGYLCDLSEQLAQERSTAQNELVLLLKNIEHIKEIVSMQQRYARGFGVVQTLAVADLIEDALRMNSNALDRHGVTVIRDFQAVPLLHVDKHKLLQIIVNLIANARRALDDAAPLKKRLCVVVRPVELGASVQICVDDNGIGISEKNLARLFSHGFTTRADGHGFGLHNGAVSAKQMGGTLTAHSEGHLRGATFTLTLPVHAPNPT